MYFNRKKRYRLFRQYLQDFKQEKQNEKKNGQILAEFVDEIRKYNHTRKKTFSEARYSLFHHKQ